MFYAAFVYDSLMLLDSGVRAVHGEIGDKKALRSALEAAHFQSTRGTFAFNTNHFPIQNFYAARVIKKDGVLQHEIVSTIFENHKDSFYQECHMPQ